MNVLLIVFLISETMMIFILAPLYGRHVDLPLSILSLCLSVCIWVHIFSSILFQHWHFIGIDFVKTCNFQFVSHAFERLEPSGIYCSGYKLVHLGILIHVVLTLTELWALILLKYAVFSLCYAYLWNHKGVMGLGHRNLVSEITSYHCFLHWFL